MTNPRTWLVVALVATTPSLAHRGASRTEAQTSTVEIMQEKLDEAQQLLEAVVRADFEGARERAGRLEALSELQSWYVLPTPEYAEHSETFREAAQAVVGAGKREHAGSVFDGYMSLVKQCVDCHDYMRRVRAPQPSR